MPIVAFRAQAIDKTYFFKVVAWCGNGRLAAARTLHCNRHCVRREAG
jgi:hypothetical protein